MGNSAGKNYVPKHSGTGSNSKRVHWGSAGLPAPPGKPILIPVSMEDTQPDIVGIRWERSPSNGGSAIVGYQVEHRRLGSPYWVRSSPSLCSFPELTLSGLEPGWRYQFRVRARNGLGLSEPSKLSDPLTVTLQRSAASAPRFDLELADTVALENDQAEFTVHFSGTPLPKISWFKDGFEIFSSRRTRIITENGKSQLLIHQTALNDEGEIKCTATNRAGHVSTKAKLALEAPPKIRLPRQYEDGLLFEQDETIRLKVSLAGRPLPSITWYHDGDIVAADPGHVLEISEAGESALRITAAKRQDRGEYTVKATNKLGEHVTSFLVTVTDRPSAPGRATIAMTLGRSVTLAWSEPEDDGGCKIGTYIVEYYRIGWDVWLKAATCRQPTTTLGELIEGSEYRFRVKAENPYGVSDPSEESDVVFIPDPKRGRNYGYAEQMDQMRVARKNRKSLLETKEARKARKEEMQASNELHEEEDDCFMVLESPINRINAPPKRPDKSQSQHEIRRGRGQERRNEFHPEPTKRTRSLTREKAIRGAPGDGFEGGPPTRSASAHRLAPIPPSRPSRADSRVTFADTVFLHVEKPLENSSTPTRPKTKRDKNPPAEDADRLPIKKDRVQGGLEKAENAPTKIVSHPTFDDSGGRNTAPADTRRPSLTREKSPSPVSPTKVRDTLDYSKNIEATQKKSTFVDAASPRESSDLDDEGERSLRGSSEFMLVLYPDENSNAPDAKLRPSGSPHRDSEPLERSRLRSAFSEGDAEDSDSEEDLVAPPMSLSLPELFSTNHQVVEVLREAVSSTELLHERAMERFYRAVALEEAEAAKKTETSEKSAEKRGGGGGDSSPGEGPSLSPSSLRLRNARLRRRPSSSGSPVLGMNAKGSCNRRRSSEGQTTITKTSTGLPAALLLPMPELVASDPNLPEHDLARSSFLSGTSGLSYGGLTSKGSSSQPLHRWDEKSMPLVPTESLESGNTLLTEVRSSETGTSELERAKINLAEELYEEESEEELEDEEEESDSSEDLRLLKSRILAQPVVDEEDTYHPRGKPIPRLSSPEVLQDHHGSLTPNHVAPPQPKSILKKRTEEEPIPVNRYGRPIPPEMPIPERQANRNEDETEPESVTEANATIRKKSLTGMPEATRTPVLSELDKDNATLLSTAEAARSRRKLSPQKAVLPKRTSIEEEEDLQARMAVIDHYTEIVREYSMAHSVHPPATYQRGNSTLPQQTSKSPTGDSSDKSESDRTSSPSPLPILRRDLSTERQIIPGATTRKGEVSRGGSGVNSRLTTSTAGEAKNSRETRRRPSRNQSPEPRNVSSDRSNASLRKGSSSGGSGSVPGRARKREKSGDRSAPASRSSSGTRNRETSRERPTSRLQKERSGSQTRGSSRASSRERRRTIEPSPSDSETSTRLASRKRSDSRKLERFARAGSAARRTSNADAKFRKGSDIVGGAVDERLAIEAARKIRSTVSYATDLTLLLAAIYVYLFKKEILAVPLIGLLLYRRIQEDIHAWIPKRWRSTDAAPGR